MLFKTNYDSSEADEEMYYAVDIEQNFVEDLDDDGDGYLDKKELIKWVEPEGFQGVCYLSVVYCAKNI